MLNDLRGLIRLRCEYYILYFESIWDNLEKNDRNIDVEFGHYVILMEKYLLKIQYQKNTEGTARDVSCSNFETIAGETVKHFTNYAKSPYEDIPYGLKILTYIGDPPKDGQFAYYPESAGFKLRVRCRGKVTSYQWPF